MVIAELFSTEVSENVLAALCLKPDAPVCEGDILSLRGKGKAAVLDAGSRESKKGRLFIKVGFYR